MVNEHEILPFQYPRTDRMGCNYGTFVPRGKTKSFQYPRTDRMGCNVVTAQPVFNAFAPFSILERIEWAATVGADAQVVRRPAFSILERIEWAATAVAPGRARIHTSFQYPRTDRMGCNHRRALWPRTGL